MPDKPDTDQFLFEGKNIFYNSIRAFQLNGESNLLALKRMELYKSGNEYEKIVIIKLPEIVSETSRDWHGTKFPNAFNKVIEITELETSDISEKGTGVLYLGKLFWNAFLKGGIQGGVYIIDTIRERIKNNRSLI